MKTRHQIQLGIVGFIALAVSAIWHASDDDTGNEIAAPASPPAQVASTGSTPTIKAPEAAFAAAPKDAAQASATGAETTATAGDVTFQADASGKIVKNEDARLNLEKLYALSSPAEAQQKLEELRHELPPSAATELTELATQYQNYQTAALQAYPPGFAPATPEDGLNEIDGQHALRAKYFGAKTAEAFYGSDEKVQRELLRLMNLEKDQSLTMEEKADRAQQLYNDLPEISRLGDKALKEAAAEAMKKHGFTGPDETPHEQ